MIPGLWVGDTCWGRVALWGPFDNAEGQPVMWAERHVGEDAYGSPIYYPDDHLNTPDSFVPLARVASIDGEPLEAGS